MTDILLSRVLPGAFFALVFLAKASSFYPFVHRTPVHPGAMSDLTFYSSVIYQALQLGFLGLVVVLFIARSAPIRKSCGIWPKISGLAGAFILTAVAAMPQSSLSWQVDALASLLLAGGMAITLFALAHLGRCFSILPEVRGAVMTGPYRYVRHPMYLGEILSGLGMVLASPSWISSGIFLLFVWLQIHRMRFEERGLRDIFPRYDAYVQRTSRLVPGLY